MMTVRIALRNVLRHKRRTLLTVLTMSGGFTLCSMSIAWSDGTYNRIIDLFTRYDLGHIQIHRAGYLDKPSLYATVDDYEDIGRILASVPRVESSTPRLYSAGLVSVADKSAGARIVGIDPASEIAATEFDRKVTAGRFLAGGAAHEALLGEGLAERLGAAPGDEVVVVSQGADGSIANDAYTIVGLLATGDPAEDQITFYLHLTDAQELLVLEGRVHEIVVINRDLRTVAASAADIRASIGDPALSVDPWQVFAKSFYQAMKADQDGMWISLLIIILIVAVGVLNTVLMNVLERTREYGLLRAIGTRPLRILGLVLWEVVVMAAIALVIGAVSAWIINSLVAAHGIPMPYELTYGGIVFNRMYSEINVRSFVIPGITVVISALFISVFPAIRAARTAPAAAMRTH